MKVNALLKIESIIFDFDGTLAELHIDFAEMKRRLLSLARSYCPAIGSEPFLPVLEWLAWLDQELRKGDGVHAGEFRERGLELIQSIEMEAARKGSLFAFTRPMLGGLIEKKVSVGIITRNCESAVRTVFPDIADHCHAFLARDHVPSPKPDPAHLVSALRTIDAQPGAALMVGDHPIDIQTGKAAGTLTAGVCSGNASREDLLQAGADWVACDCEELIRGLTESGLLQ